MISKFQEEHQQRLVKIRSDLEYLTAKDTELSENIEKYNTVKISASTRVNVLKKCESIFDNDFTPNLSSELNSEEYNEISVILSNYISAFNSSALRDNTYRTIVTTIQRNEIALEKLSEELLKADAKKYENILRNIDVLSFANIYHNFIVKEFKKYYSSYHEKYTNHKYRHKLIFKLLLCSFYYPTRFVKDNFINIDEAQDLSVIEYRLLSSILGRQATFNLYGDINQLVYQYKGVYDWTDLCSTLSMNPETNIYVLNENYRNTEEITEFCNTEFGAEITSIGISGEAVKELGFSEAINWLTNKKRTVLDSRCAIIYRYGMVEIEKCIRDITDEGALTWYKADSNKISALSVEAAKGMEFDFVVAVVSNMTENEKYIAYTRALEALVVVRDEFSDIIEESDISSGDEDDGYSVDMPITELLPESDILDINSLRKIFDNMSRSYKIFWFKAILHFVYNNHQSVKYDDLVNKMIIDAWDVVVKNNNTFKRSDSLEKMVLYIKEFYVISDDDHLLKTIRKSNDRQISEYKKAIISNVPYRFLSPFFNERKSANWKGSPNKLAEAINKYNNIMYRFETIDGLNSVIKINDDWFEYLSKNQELLEEWITSELEQYLM